MATIALIRTWNVVFVIYCAIREVKINSLRIIPLIDNRSITSHIECVVVVVVVCVCPKHKYIQIVLERILHMTNLLLGGFYSDLIAIAFLQTKQCFSKKLDENVFPYCEITNPHTRNHYPFGEFCEFENIRKLRHMHFNPYFIDKLKSILVVYRRSVSSLMNSQYRTLKPILKKQRSTSFSMTKTSSFRSVSMFS